MSRSSTARKMVDRLTVRTTPNSTSVQPTSKTARSSCREESPARKALFQGKTPKTSRSLAAVGDSARVPKSSARRTHRKSRSFTSRELSLGQESASSNPRQAALRRSNTNATKDPSKWR